MGLISPSEEFVNYINDLQEDDCRDLVFNSIPGIDVKDELSIDFSPIGSAMRHNTYFRSFEVRNSQQKNISDCVATFLQYNRTVSSIIISDSASEIPDQFGLSLQSNRMNNLQILNLSGTKFKSDSAIIAFSYGLQRINHSMTAINLDNTMAHSIIGASLIFRSLQLNPGLSLSLEEFHFSGNKMDLEAVNILLDWLRGLAINNCKLHKLSLATSLGSYTGSIMVSPILLQLSYLDISENKFDKSQLENLSSRVAELKDSFTIIMRDCSVPSDSLAKYIRQLLSNTNLTQVAIDISRNQFGLGGIQQLTEEIKRLTFQQLSALDLTDNGIKPKALCDLLLSLPTSINRLILDGNFSVTPETEELALTLGVFVNNHPNLFSLSMAGLKGQNMGKKISPFLELLGKNNTLKELNISYHNMGPTAFSTLCNALRKNSSLRWLHLDRNGITYNCFLLLLQTIKKCSLQAMYFPRTDATRDPRSFDVAMEIYRLLSLKPPYVPIPSPFSMSSSFPTWNSPVVTLETALPLVRCESLESQIPNLLEYRHPSGVTVSFVIEEEEEEDRRSKKRERKKTREAIKSPKLKSSEEVTSLPITRASFKNEFKSVEFTLPTISSSTTEKAAPGSLTDRALPVPPMTQVATLPVDKGTTAPLTDRAAPTDRVGAGPPDKVAYLMGTKHKSLPRQMVLNLNFSESTENPTSNPNPSAESPRSDRSPPEKIKVPGRKSDGGRPLPSLLPKIPNPKSPPNPKDSIKSFQLNPLDQPQPNPHRSMTLSLLTDLDDTLKLIHKGDQPPDTDPSQSNPKKTEQNQ
eukprot:TRINITY_DN5404_c0_g1_i1.p1 TRINITY_DN5404_c0_g1~~TRINITY_DN5404_c0_g1_i1.p1  ORF type:complete len:912 (+),score=196.37 TRINITY_DN5404_c0_g1_i1:321-2738(+)